MNSLTTNANSASDAPRHDETMDWSFITWIQVVALLILSIAIIIGNSIVIFSSTCSSPVSTMKQRLPRFFVVNLAVADLLIGILAIPVVSLAEIIRGNWPFGDELCLIRSYACVLCFSTSIFTVGVISLDRYIAVTRPLTYNTIITKKVNVFILIFIWFIASVISFGTRYIWGSIGFECFDHGFHADHISSSILVGCFSLTVIVVCTFYWRIYKIVSVRERQIKMGRISGTLRVHIGGSQNGAEDSSPTTTKLLESEKKAAKVMAMIIGTFVVCWFPYFVILLLTAVRVDFSVRDDLDSVFILLGFLNSCINPFIYAANSNNVRRMFKNILKCHHFKLWIKNCSV